MPGNGPSDFPPVRRECWEARAGASVRSRDLKMCSFFPLPCRDVGRRQQLAAAVNGSMASIILKALSVLMSSTRCYLMRPQSPLSCRGRSSWQFIQGFHQIKSGLHVSLSKKISEYKMNWICHKQHMRTNHFKCRNHCINRLFLLIITGLYWKPIYTKSQLFEEPQMSI